MNKFIKKIIPCSAFIFIFEILFTGINNEISAADVIERTKPEGGIPNPIDTTSFTVLLERIIGYLIVIGAPILALMVLYGGFMILTAGGNPEKFKTGKDVILYAVIGYVIILVSWGVIYIIGEILGAPNLVNKI